MRVIVGWPARGIDHDVPGRRASARNDQRLRCGAQRRSQLRDRNDILVRHQRKLDAGQLRGGRPHACGVRPTDTHRIDQQHLHAAIAHRTREIVRRVPMRRHRQRRRAARRTRDTPSQDGRRDRRCRQASAVVQRRAASPVRWAAPVASRCNANSTTGPTVLSRRTKHRDQPRRVALRAGQCHAPHVRRHTCHGIERQRGCKRHARAHSTAKPGVQRHAVGATRRIQPVELGPANRLALRSAQRESAEGRSLAHGLKDRRVRSQNRWQPPCHPGWWWTASDRRSACRLPRGSPSPSTSRRDRRRATPDW